jgi:IS605 OrfB family transposase
VKLVVQVKLLPDAVQGAALAETLRTVNAEADRVSAWASANRVRSRRGLQRGVYRGLKQAGLSAQPALHVIRKVADAYTTLDATIRAGHLGPEGSKRRAKAASKPVAFRPDAAHPFDDRCLSWRHDLRTIGMWTVHGRVKDIPFTGAGDRLALLAAHRRGETDLVHRDGSWLLVATCDVPGEPGFEPDGWLGVDLGIVNVATTGDGRRHVGRRVNCRCERMLKLRRRLQAKRTKSARRVLKRLRRRESRFVRDVNHVLSKQIVTVAQRTRRGIALEDLTGIRHRARLRTPQRVMLHSWAFAQLGAFLAYKATRAGVPLVHVDPRDTSRTCAECHHVDKRNRPSQAVFHCRACDHRANADHNASRTIGHKAETAWNAGRQSSAPTAA